MAMPMPLVIPRLSFRSGQMVRQTVAVDFGDISASGNAAFALLSAGAGTGGFISAGTTASAITTASKAVTSIDSAITSVNSQRSTFGAAINQLTYAIDNLSSVKVNAEASPIGSWILITPLRRPS